MFLLTLISYTLDTFLLFLKTVGVIVFTSLLATNLIGFFIRTLYHQSAVNSLRDNIEYESLREQIDSYAPKKQLSFMVFFFGLLILVALFLYYKYLGVYVAIALFLMIIFRIPDLINNIQGKSPDKKNYLLTFLTWLPILLIIWNYFFK